MNCFDVFGSLLCRFNGASFAFCHSRFAADLSFDCGATGGAAVAAALEPNAIGGFPSLFLSTSARVYRLILRVEEILKLSENTICWMNASRLSA